MTGKRLWILILSLSSLASSFAAAAAGELDGSWRNGTWIDNNQGHDGPLRGRFRETTDGNYRVVFTGRFRKVIPFRFATTLNVVGRDGDKVILAGEARVGFFGRFTYSGVADANQFDAQYQSRGWSGEFHLSR